MSQDLTFEFRFGKPTARRTDGGPLRMLVLGDFSGADASDRPPLAERPTHRVDVDSLDAVFTRLRPRAALPHGTITFESIDDFHPDRLYDRSPVFEALRATRARPADDGTDLLAGLLGASPRAAAPQAPVSGLDAVIRNAVAPHVVKDTAAQTKAHLAAVDQAITLEMRAMLHAPALQAREAAWRGVQWLLAGLDLDANLQLHLFDVSRDEMLADLGAANGQLTQSGLYRALVERNAAGGGTWSLMVGLNAFGPGSDDLGLLAALGFISGQAGGAFVGGADAALTEKDSPALGAWRALRASPVAPYIALVAPRMLLRAAYGKGSEQAERFAFEEFTGSPSHEEFLWASGSLAAASLLGQAFMADQWEMQADVAGEIGDLPVFTHVRDGERELQAGAERYLSAATAEAWLASGVCPLLSDRQRNAVRLVRLQSVAQPPQPLAGPWASR